MSADEKKAPVKPPRPTKPPVHNEPQPDAGHEPIRPPVKPPKKK